MEIDIIKATKWKTEDYRKVSTEILSTPENRYEKMALHNV